MTALTIGERDLRILLELSEPRHAGDPVESVWESALSALKAVVPCDSVTLQIQDVGRRRVSSLREWDGSYVIDDDLDRTAVEEYWRSFWSSQCSYPQRTGDYVTVTRASDHFCRPDVNGRRTPVRTSISCHEVMVPLPMQGSLDYRLILWRDGIRDFSERDLLLLTFLRPHLVAIRNMTFRSRAGAADLTTRQRQLLTLVATGLTNRQIARELRVSEHTVRKHLENIFERLQVSSRTAAIARAFPRDPP